MGRTDGKIIGLISSMSFEKLSKYSFIAFSVWTFTPVMIMLLNIANVDVYKIITLWKMALYFSGGSGLILGGTVLYKLIDDKVLKKEKLIDYLQPMFFLALIGIWCIFCTLFATEKRIAIYGFGTWNDCLFMYLFYFGMALLGFSLSVFTENLKWSLYEFATILDFICVFSLINSEITRNFFENELSENSKYLSVFFDSNHFGRLLLMSILIMAFAYITSNSKVTKVIAAVSFLLQLTMLILNDSVIYYWILFFTMLVILPIFIFKGLYDRQGTLMILALFMTISLAFLIFSLQFLHNLLSVNVIFMDKLKLWQSSLGYYHNRPIIGVGPQNVLFSTNNALLQFGIYTGVPGVLMYVAFVYLLFKKVLRLNVKLYPFRGASIAMAGYLISSFFCETTFYITPYFFFLVGVFICYIVVNGSSESEHKMIC